MLCLDVTPSYLFSQSILLLQHLQHDMLAASTCFTVMGQGAMLSTAHASPSTISASSGNKIHCIKVCQQTLGLSQPKSAETMNSISRQHGENLLMVLQAMLKYHAASGEVRLTADRDYKAGQSCLLPPHPLLTLVLLTTVICDLGLKHPVALLLLWNRHASSIQGCTLAVERVNVPVTCCKGL